MALPFIGPASLNPQQGGGGGITSVKLSPAAVRFPTARRQAPRRSVEPTTKEKFAPLAPFLVGGIMDMFQGKPETLTDEQYLQNLKNGDAPRRAYYSLSSKEYENLSMDMAEVTRYTKDILSIIKYCREYDKKEEKADE